MSELREWLKLRNDSKSYWLTFLLSHIYQVRRYFTNDPNALWFKYSRLHSNILKKPMWLKKTGKEDRGSSVRSGESQGLQKFIGSEQRHSDQAESGKEQKLNNQTKKGFYE